MDASDSRGRRSTADVADIQRRAIARLGLDARQHALHAAVAELTAPGIADALHFPNTPAGVREFHFAVLMRATELERWLMRDPEQES